MAILCTAVESAVKLVANYVACRGFFDCYIFFGKSCLDVRRRLLSALINTVQKEATT